MEIINSFFDMLLHIDKHLLNLVSDYSNWTYLILFCIIFCETGLVITPFLPGDSLLFAAGAIAALGLLNIWVLIGLLILAAFLGDSVNYSIGRFFGRRVFEREYWLIKQKHLIRTQDFYVKHGGKTIIIARFVPIIRTFAPFVAGIGRMNYAQFLNYNLIGGVLWVTICSIAGYFFGNIPVVKNNFSMVLLAIIAISLLPMLIEFGRYKLKVVKIENQ